MTEEKEEKKGMKPIAPISGPTQTIMKGIQMDTSWTTRHEINFIKGLGLGKWSKDSLAVKECTRSELLLRYLKGAEARDRWDGIDRDQVLRFVNECIRHELPN